MTEEIIVEQTPVQEVPVAVETAPTEVTAAPTPEKKKRGRKPKSALALPPPPPPPAPVEVRKPRKRRGPSRPWENPAIAAAEKDRAKCIEELSKIMEQWDVKQARLKSLDWKISALKGITSTSAIAGMQLQSYAQPSASGYPLPPQYPQPPAYPAPLPAYTPPSMRTPSVPAVPQAGGGAIEGIVETQTDDEDQFLKGAGVIGEKGWV